jgi:hypothetical protein
MPISPEISDKNLLGLYAVGVIGLVAFAAAIYTMWTTVFPPG